VIERRLLLAYLGTFGATFLVAALIVRSAFISSLDQATTTRLLVLASAGLRSTLFDGAHLAVDRKEISNTSLLERYQGLQWFDLQHHLLASEGLTPNAELTEGHHLLTVHNQTFDTVTTPILIPNTPRRIGTVRASEVNVLQRTNIHWFDVGLSIGTLLAIVGSTIAGLALTHQAVLPVARAFETLRDFSADASHELRGPLAAIVGNADGALRDPERNAVHDRSRFEAIADAAKQMSRLTNDLLLLASADRPLERELFVVDLMHVIDKLTTRYRPRFADARISFTQTIEQGAIVYGNPDQIERILANLIENALHYTMPGGSVQVASGRDRGQTVIVVRDTGIGIPPEYLNRVFDRFWRLDPTRLHEGSGLGLAIARALAHRHGGDVRVSSQVGVGSEFVATFPIRPSSTV